MRRPVILGVRRIGAVAVVAICFTAAKAQSTPELLSRLDEAARFFTGATANIRVTTHTDIINENDTQIGTVTIKRLQHDMRFLMKFTGKDAQEIALRGRRLEIYYPNLNTIREYDIGKYKDLAQKLMLLGFGMAGHELAANYEIKNLGTEPIESQQSMHLQLIPRAPEVLAQLSRVDLWISLNTNCPVQQKFYASKGGDYRLVTYSDIEIKRNLPSSALDLPKSAHRERVN